MLPAGAQTVKPTLLMSVNSRRPYASAVKILRVAIKTTLMPTTSQPTDAKIQAVEKTGDHGDLSDLKKVISIVFFSVLPRLRTIDAL